MTHGIYCIKDGDAQEYGPIFLAVNDKVAVRNFHNMFSGVTQEKDPFSLWCLGRYITSDGLIEVEEKREVPVE